jgi:long-subunit fatty acid transport protein
MMKAITLCTAVLLVTLISNNATAQKVQVEKGTFIAGLNFSANSANQTDSFGVFYRGQMKINYSPFVSYAVAKNLTVGAYLAFNRIDDNPISFSKYNHNFSAAIFARKYIPISNKFYGFAQADLRYTTQGLTSGSYNITNKITGLNLSGGLGYNISKRFSVEMGLNNIAGLELTRSNFTTNFDAEKYNRIRFNGGRFLDAGGLSIGVTFRF